MLYYILLSASNKVLSEIGLVPILASNQGAKRRQFSERLCVRRGSNR